MEEFIDEVFIHVEDALITSLMKKLKPELAKKMVWRVSDGVMKRGEGVDRANIQLGMKPPVITFYTKAIAESHFEMMVKDLKAIIRHEIAHIFVGTDEDKAGDKENDKFKIFIE